MPASTVTKPDKKLPRALRETCGTGWICDGFDGDDVQHPIGQKTYRLGVDLDHDDDVHRGRCLMSPSLA